MNIFHVECDHEECGPAMCDRRVRAERVLDSFTPPTIYTFDPKVVTRPAVVELVKQRGYTFAQCAAWFNVSRAVVVAVVTRLPDHQAEEALRTFRERAEGDMDTAIRIGAPHRPLRALRETLGLPGGIDVAGRKRGRTEAA